MRKRTIAIIFISAFLVFITIMLLNKEDGCTKKDGAVCKIKVNGKSLHLTVAYSRQAQMKGLMGITDLKDGEGMIFVYDTPQVLSFWMKNTMIPLSIAYVQSDGEIVQIYDMYPELDKPDWELRSYASPALVKYAIEVPQGWFYNAGIKVPAKLRIPKGLK